MTTKCSINLEKCDSYDNNIVPDEDVEICLKVLRTIRNIYLDPKWFDADGAVTLSHAHAKIHDIIKAVQKAEANEKEEKSISTP